MKNRSVTGDSRRAKWSVPAQAGHVSTLKSVKKLEQFQNSLVILLIVAGAISAASWAYERDAGLPYEAIAIFAVVLLNATMGYLQESRAEAAVAALRSMTAAEATVIRGGERTRLAGADLVVGDGVDGGGGQVTGNGGCHHGGALDNSIRSTHLTHQNPRRPGATSRAG